MADVATFDEQALRQMIREEMDRGPGAVRTRQLQGQAGLVGNAARDYGVRANHQLTGGGTVAWSAAGFLSWTQRFICISQGINGALAPFGYHEISQPPAGTAIPAAGGGAVATVATAAGVDMSATTFPPLWGALYYILPLGDPSVVYRAANFRVASYPNTGPAYDVPPHWVLIAVRNDDPPAPTLHVNSS